MMDSYDLFSAMSGASEDLVMRSDYRAKHRKQEWLILLTEAACLVIVLIGIISISLTTGPDPHLSTQPTVITLETDPSATEPGSADFNEPLKLNGGDVGTLNILQLSYIEETASMPEFLMYIDSENYYLTDDGESFYIYQKNRAENKPACWLTLTWEGNSTVEQALHQQSTNLSALMESVTVFESNPLLDGPMIQGSNGSAWDSAQTEVYIVSDQHNGVFILTLQYYLDDTDAHAVRFRDMLQTFELVTDDRLMPNWMADLRSTVDDFTVGFLKNDFSGIQDLISENAEICTYDADVHSKTRVLKTQYTLDSDTTPTSAQVSVRHKYLENDTYDYITMELKYDGEKWQVAWAMIER